MADSPQLELELMYVLKCLKYPNESSGKIEPAQLLLLVPRALKRITATLTSLYAVNAV